MNNDARELYAGRDSRELVHLIQPGIDLQSPGGGKQVARSGNVIERCNALTSETVESSLCTCRRNNSAHSLFAMKHFRQDLRHVLWKWSENQRSAWLFPRNIRPPQLVDTDACSGGSFGRQSLT